MAYTKTQWNNDALPAINAGNLNKIENGIYEAHNSIDNLKNYSTNESVVGIWIDGKPIYRKVINYLGRLNSGANLITHNILNLKKIIKAYGSTDYSSTDHYIFGSYEMNNNFLNILYINSTNVIVQVGENWGNSFQNGCVIILEYTKTTD